MKDVIVQIFNNYGTDILLEEKRFCAIVDDLAMDFLLERKIIHRLSDCHLLVELYQKVLSKKDISSVDCLKYYSRLRQEGFSEEWIYDIYSFFDLPIERCRTEENAEKNTIDSEVRSNNYNIVCLSDEVIDFNLISQNDRNRIEAIVLRTGVQHIKQMAFSGMPKLKYIYISDTVETIGKKAFFNCPQLELVEVERNYGFENPIQVASDVFQDSPKAIITSYQEYADVFVLNRLPFVSQEELIDKESSYDLNSLIVECYNLLRTNITNEEKDRIFSAETKILKNSNDDYFIPKGYPVVDVSLIPINKLFSFPFDKIKSLTFPDGVKEITGSLKQLYNKGLKTVFLPSTLESISPLLFEGCQQLSIRCPSDAQIRAKIRELGRNPKSVKQEHFLNYKESELH